MEVKLLGGSNPLEVIMKDIKPLSNHEWENIHTDAEMPSVGISIEDGEAQKQAKNVLILSQEIRRLKKKLGEEVWEV